MRLRRALGPPLFDIVGLADAGWDHLSPTDFQLFLQRRLLALSPLPMTNMSGPVWCRCFEDSIARRVDLRQHRFHDRGCALCGPLRTECHNAIVGRVVQFVRSLLAEAHIKIEPRFEDPERPDLVLGPNIPGELRPDVQILYHGVALYVDVSVVDPAAAKYLRDHQSHLYEGAAATAQEKVKDAKYEQLCHNSFMAGQFYPFVLEATGRLGGSARQFMRAVTKLSREHPATHLGSSLEWDVEEMHETSGTDQERFLVHDIAVINAKYGSKMTKHVLNHIFQAHKTEAALPYPDG